jgi:TPR repeat protein
LRTAAKQNNPIAQNRLAWVLANGQGVPVDKVEALKWHTIAKTAGKGDPELDKALSTISEEDKARAGAAVRKWFGTK